MDIRDQVRTSINIVDVVGEHVRLRPSGPSRYMGLCPFHNEKKPSFTVHVVHQFYKCFSCGAGGDVFKFLQETQGISFYEALKLLADRCGVAMPKRGNYSDDDSRRRAALFRMHELAQENFRANLKSSAGEAARSYLARRGVAAETIEHFGLGYSERAGRALQHVLEGQDFSAVQVEESGLVGKRQDGSFYDRFRNRLMFPIHDESGRIIGFGGRALSADDEPKYLNSPETPIYKKSRVLYNLHRAKESIRREDRVILVEGYMDAIGVSAAGFPGVVASCGTSLTTEQIQALKRHSQNMVMNFDPDPAGANATEKRIEALLQEGMQVRILELEDGLDPDEYCKDRGAEAYAEKLRQAKGYFHWLADRARARFDIHTSEGVVSVLKFLLPAVHRISDRLERVTIANDLAGYIGVDRGMVLDSFRKSVADRQEKTFERPQVVLRHDERMLLSAILRDAEIRDEVLEELKSIDAIHAFASRHIFQVMFGLHDAGGQIGFDEIHARLEEADQGLLAEAVLNDDSQASREEVMAAVASMRRSHVEEMRRQLKLKIRESERGGHWEDALRLTGELQTLERDQRARR
ncbi:MAG TPA: DNA primase [Candidatus Sulfopaludibacter sp.]|jgi:DNA primase|nr:DNA primase [Candidatus Sulfopaludibacter sp.]